MASTITAGNATNGLALSCDNTGILELKTGTGSGTTAITADASQNVTVAGTLTAPSVIPSSSTAPTNGVFLPAANTLGFSTASTERARIDSSGNLLVGTTSTPNYGAGVSRMYLQANATNWGVGPTSSFGNFYVKANNGLGVVLTPTATSWASDSDERKKTELTPFDNAVEKISSLRAGTGRYLVDEKHISRSFLIAQDVQAVLPEAVDANDDEQGSLILRYTDVIPLLVAAIKEQQQMIEELKAEVAALKGAA